MVPRHGSLSLVELSLCLLQDDVGSEMSALNADGDHENNRKGSILSDIELRNMLLDDVFEVSKYDEFPLLECPPQCCALLFYLPSSR